MGISVCMINRNGAATLHRCLESVKPFAEEIIFVDTGSTDESIAIAQEFGAKVYHFKWIDDFASARNFAISKATSDKIFQIDSDDVVTEACCDGLVSVKDKPINCYVSFVVHNINAVKRDPPILEKFMQARLFPNHRGIKYGAGACLCASGKIGKTDGRIHESFAQSAYDLGIFEEQCCGVIEHHGYSDPAVLRAKDDRNIRLYMLMFGATEDFPWSWFDFGQYRCVYIPNVVAIWRNMSLIALGEPFKNCEVIPTDEEDRRQLLLDCVFSATKEAESSFEIADQLDSMSEFERNVAQRLEAAIKRQAA